MLPLAVVLTGLSGQEPAPIIESVEIVVRDVFEDEQGEAEFWPYALANRLHLRTRKRVIERELLFGSGDPLDEEAVAQTERNLRSLPFLRDVEVNILETALSGRVKIRVVASDSWTTVPEVRLAKVGNEWVWALGAAERNLLGYGKHLQVLRAADLDREQTLLFYGDPRLGGSRFRLSTLFSDATDGHELSVFAERPFFALDTLWSFRFGVEDFDRLDPLYDEGERVQELRHQRSFGEIAAARSIYRSPDRAVRFHFGYQRSTDDVEADRRQFGVLQLGVTTVQHAFVKMTYVNRFEKAEDFNLGNEAGAFFGVSTELLGGEPGTSYFFYLSEKAGLSLGQESFLTGLLSWRGRHRNGGTENSIARARFDLVRKWSQRVVMLMKGDFLYGTRLDPEVQLRLGAESGLKGYPVRQFNGNRSLLLAAEARWFLADDIARLVSLGVAAFAESGYAWPEERPIAIHDLSSDIGVSLLLGFSRASAARPGIRIDFAYAMTSLEGRGRWLVSAGSRIGL
ncbi:MAG TPA: hypothetical protein VLK65_13715 [Vicinamibacteria bacterium]|nr:hypothetical protein [Vicinamibacteria bacterium]